MINVGSNIIIYRIVSLRIVIAHVNTETNEIIYQLFYSPLAIHLGAVSFRRLCLERYAEYAAIYRALHISCVPRIDAVFSAHLSFHADEFAEAKSIYYILSRNDEAALLPMTHMKS